VVERERLAAAWGALSEANRAALNRWLAAPGGVRPGGLTASEITLAVTARNVGRRVLDELA
jgi:hypothetical protein